MGSNVLQANTGGSNNGAHILDHKAFPMRTLDKMVHFVESGKAPTCRVGFRGIRQGELSTK